MDTALEQNTALIDRAIFCIVLCCSLAGELADGEVMFGGGDASIEDSDRSANTESDSDEHLTSDENSGRSVDSASLLEIDNRVSGQGVLSAASLVSTASSAKAGVAEPWEAGPAKFKSLKYRCEKLKAVVEGALGGMTAAFKAKACSCMGCCAGECFFHVKERMTE